MSDVATVTKSTDAHPSFTGHAHTRCFRAGGVPYRSAPRVDLGKHCVQLVPPGEKAWRQSSIWKVRLTKRVLERWPKQPEQFWVVSLSYDGVISYLTKRFGDIIRNQSGLARATLTEPMKEICTLPPPADGAGHHAREAARKHSKVETADSGKSYSVHIEDDLMYAMDAVKGGEGGVQNALKSAANRIAGQIKHMAGASLSERLPTPFPEVKRRK